MIRVKSSKVGRCFSSFAHGEVYEILSVYMYGSKIHLLYMISEESNKLYEYLPALVLFTRTIIG